MSWAPVSVAALIVFISLIGLRLRARRKAARLDHVRRSHAARQNRSHSPSPAQSLVDVTADGSSSFLSAAQVERSSHGDSAMTNAPVTQTTLASATSSTSPPQPAKSISSTSATMTRDSSFSVIYETARSSVHRLVTATKRGDTKLLVLLKDALVDLVNLGNSIQGDYWPVDTFDTFKSRVEAFEVIVTAPGMGTDAEADVVVNYIRFITEVIEQLWAAIAATTEAAITADNMCDDIPNLLIALTAILETLELDDEVAVEDRLALVCQCLRSCDSVPLVEHEVGVRPSLRDVTDGDLSPRRVVVNNNSNANFSFGGGTVSNYNPINNFFFSNSRDLETPDLKRKREEVMKSIKSILGDRFIHDAVHDTQPTSAGCMPGTRVNLLLELISWITEGPTSIFWIAGMAGTGKTSVAITLSRMLEHNPSVILGGSFLCSRLTGSTYRAEARCIIPTLAASLADQLPEFAAALAAELKANDRIAHKPVSDQIVALLKEPLAALSLLPHPIIFVIDALDECRDPREVSELLIAIADFDSNRKVKFILTTRPEMHIRGTPISNPDHHTILQLHTIEEKEVAADIRRYISGTLESTPLSIDWYTSSDIEVLVRLSQGLFIFASTVLKYVLAREQVEGRRDRLRKMTSAAASNSAAISSLDKIYNMIVTEASRSDEVDADELRVTQEVIACILAAHRTLSVQALADLLNLEAGSLRGSLERLHSVICVPAEDTDEDVRVLHASFGDYIFSRAPPLVRIAMSLGDDILARGCLDVMAKRLHFNVSQSNSSHEWNKSSRPDSITLSLEYACFRWIYHCSRSSDHSAIDTAINDIFRPRLLFWMEVISVLGGVEHAAAILLFAASTVQIKDLARFLRDAHTFILSSREAIERSAPHIYLSALPFADKNSLVYKTFAPLCTGLISVETFGIDRRGGQLISTLRGHNDFVKSIAYSPDSRFLASGSEDRTVRIWAIPTGEQATAPLLSSDGKVYSVAYGPRSLAAGTDTGVICIWGIPVVLGDLRRLIGHSKAVNSLVFSPDGSILASASSDCTVRLWRPESHHSDTVLNGHTGEVNDVAFSPDGLLLASCSEDYTVRLWRVTTGDPASDPLHHQLIGIRSISFSPDGTTLAFTALGGIKLWNVRTHTASYILPSHRSQFSSVQFSPDGSSLISANSDGTISLSPLREGVVKIFSSGPGSSNFPTFLWDQLAVLSPDGVYIATAVHDSSIRILDASAGHATGQWLPAHSGAVTSLALAADGTFIVSGSSDRTVRVWDALTGESRLPPLHGHANDVSSVAISPDGRLISSASLQDCDVRLWDVRTGKAVGDPLKYHDKGVSSVAFSPDGLSLASGSGDGTVCVWNVATTQPLAISPLRCNSYVITVAFSPDNRFIAAGTLDWDLHLWHAETGQPVWEPLKTGHRRKDVNIDEMTLDDMRPVYHPIEFSPEGTRIAFGGEVGISVWDIFTCQRILHLDGGETTISSLSFSPDGQYIVSGSTYGVRVISMREETGIVCLRDVSTGRSVARLHGHGSGVRAVAFSQDGQSIVSCSNDGTIRVWDVAVALSLPSARACYSLEAITLSELHRGWLLGPKCEPLLWVPHEYWDYLQVPPCTLVIGRHRIIITGHDKGWCMGESWTACWNTDASTT